MLWNKPEFLYLHSNLTLLLFLSATCVWWWGVCRRWMPVLLQVWCWENFKMMPIPGESFSPLQRTSDFFLRLFFSMYRELNKTISHTEPHKCMFPVCCLMYALEIDIKLVIYYLLLSVLWALKKANVIQGVNKIKHVKPKYAILIVLYCFNKGVSLVFKINNIGCLV